MKVVLDEIYTFGMKVVLDELVFYRASMSMMRSIKASIPRLENSLSERGGTEP